MASRFDYTNAPASLLRTTDKVLLFLFIAVRYLSSLTRECVWFFCIFRFFIFWLVFNGKPEKEKVPGSLLGVEVFIYLREVFFFFLGFNIIIRFYSCYLTEFCMCGVQLARDRGWGVVSATHVSGSLVSKARTDGADATWRESMV